MKRLLVLLLILPALGLAQSRFGHGGGGTSVSTMLPIIADSTDWTAGTHIHAIKPKGGKSIEADSGKFGALEVTGVTTLDGELTMVTTASESLKIAAGGIRNEGGLRQKGTATFLATTAPVVIASSGANPTLYGMAGSAGTNTRRQFYFGADTLALFNGARTGRDSTVTILPNGYLGINKVPTTALDVTGAISASSTITSSSILLGAGLTLTANNNSIAGSFSGSDISVKLRSIESPNSYYTSVYFLNPDLAGLASFTGFGGFETPASVVHINNNGVYSRPLFRLSRDRRVGIAVEDSIVLMVTGSGKVSISPNTGAYGMTPADTLNLVNILGKKSSDSLLVVHNDIVGRDSVWAILPNGNVGNNGMVTIKRTVSLADQAEYTPQIPAGMCGWGTVQIGDAVEWARFRFKSDGAVTLEANSTNVTTTNDNDTTLNIYDAGTTGIIIENQLGSTLTAAVVIEAYTP